MKEHFCNYGINASVYTTENRVFLAGKAIFDNPV
ncbi:hypothetical protein SDC9_94876 [bioreactor metagenome]|uniref:Uncharacterized protein n=1 Tax=bioreactor metagenome TaxID=1076179 RepID=A0A645ABE2_9ZZZZ